MDQLDAQVNPFSFDTEKYIGGVSLFSLPRVRWFKMCTAPSAPNEGAFQVMSRRCHSRYRDAKCEETA